MGKQHPLLALGSVLLHPHPAHQLHLVRGFAQGSAVSLLPQLVGLVVPLLALRVRLPRVLLALRARLPRVLLALPLLASFLRRASAKPLVALLLVSLLPLVLPVSASLP
jgi:hypothetical protein